MTITAILGSTVYASIAARARKALIGFGGLNRLLLNHNNNLLLASVEHTPDGLHNAWEVPRALAQFDVAAGVYSVAAGGSAFISSIAKNAVGDVTITLAANKFLLPIQVEVSSVDAAGDTVPIILDYTVVDVTHVRVFQSKLAALGGNTWAAFDGSFQIKLHSQPYVSSASGAAGLNFYARGNWLDATSWNAFVQSQADAYSALSQEHLVAALAGGISPNVGDHNALEVARDYCTMKWSGTPAVYTGPGTLWIVTTTPVGTGSFDFTSDVPGGVGFTMPLFMFGQAHEPNYSGANQPGPYIITFPKNHASVTAKAYTVRQYIYRQAAGVWNYADADFDFHLYAAKF